VAEHAVLFYGRFGGTSGRDDVVRSVLGLAAELTQSIVKENTGEMDGYDLGDNEFILYMYGPDAETLWASTESILRRTKIARGGHAIIRYGEPGANERKVQL